MNLWIGIGILVVMIGGFFIGHMAASSDTTDMSRWNRSGLTVYTDQATGVQYLGTSNGLTPRIDKDGKLYSDKEL